MTDELIDELAKKLFYSKHEFPKNWGEVATIAAECVRDERERADRLQQECDDIYERLSWILAACTIDRDAKHEIEALLK